ncbi:DUF29 domain-containing protein [Azospirillum thermophilum]|uniref:DUF29 domain-containing protein n=1 Tax=Azospirillum thermophilum TaxID=2202148 RepID=A0A2S2CQ85_9PROT|nr:DUF29 domain-containing protein [Azospirillum thermophilum]AWK86636.1 DUF29 domain-containing protein [Azospirillum thermophilum]
MDGRIGYDDDFYAWTQEQARLLREAASERSNSPIDHENLAEEIEGMGRSDARALNSALMRVIEHLLKLDHSPAAAPRAGWRSSVINHRIEALEQLETSPSLRNRIELERAYRNALRLAADGLARDGIAPHALPAECPYTLGQLLDHDWWPAGRQDQP